MKRLIWACPLVLLAAVAHGQERLTTHVSDIQLDSEETSWSAEATVQTQAIGGDSSIVFGPAFVYQIDAINEVGLRTLVPLNQDFNRNAYSAQPFYRHLFTESKTSLFAEGDGSLNIVHSYHFYSVGASVGVVHRFTHEFSLGGSSGLEVAYTSITSGGVEDSARPFLYPKVAVYGAYDF